MVEYCKYGSLLAFIHCHKKAFINQINSGGELDPNYAAFRNSANTLNRYFFDSLNYNSLAILQSYVIINKISYIVRCR